MSKKLEEMTVDELINLEHHSSCRCDVDIIDYIRCELIRRARQAEQQPKWRLTQILTELEKAGLPEPTSFNNLRIIWDRFGIQVDVCFDSQWQILKQGSSGIKTFPPTSKAEAITKLKELLK